MIPVIRIKVTKDTSPEYLKKILHDLGWDPSYKLTNEDRVIMREIARERGMKPIE